MPIASVTEILLQVTDILLQVTTILLQVTCPNMYTVLVVVVGQWELFGRYPT